MPTAVENPLLEALSRLPILEPAQMHELPDLRSRLPHPRALAKELIEREWLTAYQANQIFLGHADDLVIAHYICLNKIGEGGMGQVFKARQRPLNRVVALKVLRRECLDNAKTVKRFQREIRAVGQLQHPHIVRAIDAEESGGLRYIAMEYIDGVDLARMVKRQGPLSIDAAVDYMRQAALALQHAHESGIVHRDIKPANFIVANDGGRPRHPKFRWGMVKLLDLGLARNSDPGEAQLTLMGTVMGTPDFIAPEQALNPHTCDVRADLYSLGCTFFYLIGGRIPFPRGGVTEKLIAHQSEVPEPLAAVRHARLTQESAKTGKRFDDAFHVVPADVEAVVRKLMAKRPEDRFRSGDELAHALERILARLTGDPMAITQVASLTHSSMSLTPIPSAPVVPLPAMPLPAMPSPVAVAPAVTPPRVAVPLATAVRMRMPIFKIPRPPSWQSMVKGKDPAAIVDIRVPSTNDVAVTRWWFVCALAALLCSTTILVQQLVNNQHSPRTTQRR